MSAELLSAALTVTADAREPILDALAIGDDDTARRLLSDAGALGDEVAGRAKYVEMVGGAFGLGSGQARLIRIDRDPLNFTLIADDIAGNRVAVQIPHSRLGRPTEIADRLMGATGDSAINPPPKTGWPVVKKMIVRASEAVVVAAEETDRVAAMWVEDYLHHLVVDGMGGGIISYDDIDGVRPEAFSRDGSTYFRAEGLVYWLTTLSNGGQERGMSTRALAPLLRAAGYIPPDGPNLQRGRVRGRYWRVPT